MTILVIKYCFYSLWIYWGFKFGLPWFTKHFLDTGKDRYGEKK